MAWALTMLALAAVPWLDRLLRQADRPDLLAVMLAPGAVDPSQQVLAGPFDLHGLGGVVLVVNHLAGGAAAGHRRRGRALPTE